MTWLPWLVGFWLLLAFAAAVYLGAMIRRADRRDKTPVDEGTGRHTGSYDFAPPSRLSLPRGAPPDRWTPPAVQDDQDTPGMSSAG